MHVKQSTLRQINTPQGTLTIIPTRLANFQTETGSRGPTNTLPPLSVSNIRHTLIHRILSGVGSNVWSLVDKSDHRLLIISYHI